MKRKLERSAFMLIGALIASIAYFVGNADRGAQAQDGITRFDKIECSELMVSGRAPDGTLGLTMIDVVDGQPVLTMSQLRDKTESITLRLQDEGAAIVIAHMESRSHGEPGIVMLTTPEASIVKVEDEVVFQKAR